MAYTPTYHNVTVANSVNVHYFEASDPSLPTFLLLHGFPSSCTQFCGFAPLLVHRYHLIAPDLPGFGLTQAPADFVYTFENLANVVSTLLATLSIENFALYVFDYGAPIGWRLALQNPAAITATISQNGNAYDEGFGQPFWQPVMELWSTNNSPSSRELLRETALTLAATRSNTLSPSLKRISH